MKKKENNRKKIQIQPKVQELPIVQGKSNAKEQSGGSNPIKVSVIMIAYNQEEFIAQALESILMQEVEFRYEILVGDDASNDDTPRIIMEYYEKYPDVIVPILREENIGVTKNTYDLLMRARGEYIANLEGDDKWLSPDKLQCQVNFLEEHQDYIGCTHKFMVIDHTNRIIDRNPQWTFQGREYSWKQFLAWTLPSQTGTWVYRNIYITHPEMDWTVLYKASPVASDTTTLLLLLQFGNIYKIDRFMSFYRRDYRSVSASWSATPMFIRRYNIYEMTRYYEKYALNEMKREIKFTNTDGLLMSLFTMCCDHPSKYKLECVNHILNGLEENREKYETLYEIIKLKTPLRKMRYARNRRKQRKEEKRKRKRMVRLEKRKERYPEEMQIINLLTVILREVRELKAEQQERKQ